MGYQIEYAYTCHMGRIRANNEDNFWCCGDSLEAENFGTDHICEGSESQTGFPMLAVFDGMGGESSGEMASYLAAQACGRYYRDYKKDMGTAPDRFWEGICRYMNAEVCDYAEENRIDSMGTTAAMLGFSHNHVFSCNLGDSRIYQWKEGKLLQLSMDHVFAGGIFGKAPLVQFVGIPENQMVLEPAVVKMECKPGERYLICSDGLTDMVKEPQICEILAKEERIGEAVALLQNKALEAGGRDNITIVLCEVKDNISNKKIGEWLKMLLTGKR